MMEDRVILRSRDHVSAELLVNTLCLEAMPVSASKLRRTTAKDSFFNSILLPEDDAYGGCAIRLFH